jgi:hypothetical protein
MLAYQRALFVTGISAIMLTALAGRILALPVQGNLVITSGHATIAEGAFGDDVSATVAGPGFDLSFLACAEASCVRTSPGDPGRVVAPGTVFKPTTFGALSPLGPSIFDSASATILGVTYTHQPFPIGPNSIQFLSGTSPLVFDGTFQAPSLLPATFQNITLTSPFSFSGELLIAFAGQLSDPFFDLHLIGQGTASFNLFGPVCSPFTQGLCGWGLASNTYDFSPVPEPTALLLFGTSMAGLGVVVRRRRSRRA